jgi:hypothetical protein
MIAYCTHRDFKKIKRDVPKHHPMVMAEGFSKRFGYWERYVIYQWDCEGFLVHANFFYKV